MTYSCGGALPPVPGDLNDNGVVDLPDFALLAGCLTGPNALPSSPCLSADFDEDGDVDMVDYRQLEQLLAGE